MIKIVAAIAPSARVLVALTIAAALGTAPATVSAQEITLTVTPSTNEVTVGESISVQATLTGQIGQPQFNLTTHLSSGDEQDLTFPIFEPARPDPQYTVGPDTVSFLLRAVRPGTVRFRVFGTGEVYGGWCPCWYWQFFSGTSSLVTVLTSGPTLIAAPNPVPAGFGLSSTTISWDSGDGSVGQVWVSVDGGTERLFAQGPTGSAEAPWIRRGHAYLFRLYQGTAQATALRQVQVTRLSKEPSLSVSPNPVPSGPGLGTSTATWDTGDGSVGQVWVSMDYGAEALFAQSDAGTADAPWIQAGRLYRFTLYAGTAHATALGSVNVTRIPIGPGLAAAPNPTPNNRTTITWNTGDGSWGEVWVSTDGGTELLFAGAPSGAADAPWIYAPRYVFRLYQGTGHTTVIAGPVTVVPSTS